MSDAFITLVSIQPSVSTQQEASTDADAMGTGQTKQNVYGKRRQNVIRQPNAPGENTPLLPHTLTAEAGLYKSTLTWKNTAGGVSYNVYWSTTPGVTKQSSQLAGVSSGFVHSGLTARQPYYYALAVVSAVGEGPLGEEVSAIPLYDIASPLLAPAFISCVGAGNPATVALSWSRYDPRATLFNLYWGTSPGVTKQNTKIAGLSDYARTVSGLEYATTYYFAMTTYLGDAESALSLEVSATTPAYSFSIATASAGALATNTLTLPTYKSDTLSFNIYWSETPGVTKQSTKITGAATGYAHTGLTCEKAYYYAVAAVGPSGEGPLSSEVTVTTPKAFLLPAGLVLQLDANDTASWSGSGTQWRDLSGNGYHVNGVSAALFAVQGGQTVFRTSGAQYLVSGLNLAQPCTVMTVARYNGLGSNQRGRILSSNSTNWLLGWHSNRAGVFYSAGWVANSNSITGDSAWHCAIGTCSSGSYRLYDNCWNFTETPTGGSAGPGTISLGTGQSGSEPSNADIALVFAWNRALTQAECVQAYEAIAARFGLVVSDPLIEPSTRLLYKFDAATGIETTNSGVTLTKSGTVALSATGRLGGNCWDFNKTGYGYSTAPASYYGPKNLFLGDVTIEGWMYYDTARAGVFPEWFFYAGANNGSSGRGITAFLDWSSAYGGSRKIVWLFWTGGDTQFAAANTVPNSWNHFALRRKYDSAAGNWLNEAWQNGVSVATFRNAAITSGISGLYLGADYGVTNFVGKLDTVRVSSRWRTDDELRAFFNNT